MDQLLVVNNQDGTREEMVLYAAEVARPVGGASDGVWLTGHPRMPSAHEYTNAGSRARIALMGTTGGVYAWVS